MLRTASLAALEQLETQFNAALPFDIQHQFTDEFPVKPKPPDFWFHSSAMILNEECAHARELFLDPMVTSTVRTFKKFFDGYAGPAVRWCVPVPTPTTVGEDFVQLTTPRFSGIVAFCPEPEQRRTRFTINVLVSKSMGERPSPKIRAASPW